MKRHAALSASGRSTFGRRGNRLQHKTHHLALEPLESRELLSAVVQSAFGTNHHTFVIAKSNGVPLAGTSPVAGSISPALMRQAYGINQIDFGGITGDGSGQTIAIVDAYGAPTIVTDLHAFDLQYGLPDPVLTRVNQTGGNVLPATDPAGRGSSWALETSLDVEWAHAIAPGADIVLVEATTPSDSDLYAAVNYARNLANVTVISMSWGGDETAADKLNDPTLLTPLGHAGVTFIASAGDAGAYSPDSTTKAVSYPAASPNVLSIGGTTLNIDGSGNYISESGWGDGTLSGFFGGGGGGISRTHLQPGYQAGIVTQSSILRTLPDVSMEADPNTGVSIIDSWDSPNSPWLVLGGTSLSAPMWAGLLAITNQGRTLNGLDSLSGLDTLNALYSLPSTDFHDITTGSNGFAAGTGYDLVTGRGSPIANTLIPDLVAYGTGATPTVSSSPMIESFSVSPSPVVAGTIVTLSAGSIVNPNAGASISDVQFFMEADGVSGLDSGDLFLGHGSLSNGVWSLPASTTGLTATNVLYYAVAIDSAHVASQTASALLQLNAPTANGFTITPNPISAGTPVNLSVSGVSETGGKVASVTFYLDTNGTSGLQIGSDASLGNGRRIGSTYLLSAPTDSFSVGTHQFFAVITDKGGVTSTLAADLTVQPSAPNNNFAAATLVSGNAFTVTGSNLNGTKEPGEPNHAGKIGGASSWWVWTATDTGPVTIDTAGSDFDTLLAVYTPINPASPTLNKLRSVAYNDDVLPPTDLTSQVTFNAVAGKTYYIAVDGFNGDTGSITLNLAYGSGLPITPTRKLKRFALRRK